nr:hypothetical protein [uncultured bacterium]
MPRSFTHSVLLSILLAGCSATITANPQGAAVPGASTLPASNATPAPAASASPAASPTPAASPAALTVRALEDGTYSQFEDAANQVLRTEAEYKALYAKHKPGETAPAVDFTKEMVLAVFVGFKPSGGYTVAITGVREAAGGLVVTYKLTSPPADSMNASVITYPYAFGAIPRSDKTVTFEAAK